MKTRLILIPVFLFLAPGILKSQKILTLGECYQAALAANSLSGERELFNSIWQLKDENLSKNWLPSIDAGGNIVYNSSVIDLGNQFGAIPIPGIADAIKPLPHEQYRVTLDINQVIYDGGATKNARAMEKTDLMINEKQTETDLYKLHEQVNNYYFNILLLERQKELLNSYLELITRKVKSMQSGVENGVILKSDLDILTSEKIRLTQKLAENEIRKASLLKILSDITGIQIDASTGMILPAVGNEMPEDLSRPELQLFDLRKDQLAAGIKLTESKRMPKAFGFATLGYGNPPGNNFFRDEFAPYYILGAGIKWNVFDWNKARNEKQVLSLQQDIIESRKTDMTDNLRRLLEIKKAEISSLRSLLGSDSELISVRKRISAAAESRYNNGTITATEYLNELNSEQEALISYEIHKINIAMAQVEYLNISGKEIE